MALNKQGTIFVLISSIKLISTYCILEEDGTISFQDEFSVNLDFNKDPGCYFESFDVNGDKMADLTSHDGNGNIAIVEGHIGTNIFCFIFPQKLKYQKYCKQSFTKHLISWNFLSPIKLSPLYQKDQIYFLSDLKQLGSLVIRKFWMDL